MWGHNNDVDRRPRLRRGMLLRTKGRVYQAVVRSILMYGCETLPARVAEKRVVEVNIRRIQRIR